MTLVEALVATLILSIAAAGLLSAFDAARRSTSYSELHNVATQAAERELLRVTSLKWEQIALNSGLTWASGSSLTTNPTHYISAGACDTSVSLPGTSGPCYEFNWNNTSEKEPLVLETASELASEPDKTTDPVTFTTLTASNATRLSVTVYRYITWVDDPNCVGVVASCYSTSTSTNYKRITIAATAGDLKSPVLLSTLYVNPKGEANNALFDGAKCVEEGKPITETHGVECT